MTGASTKTTEQRLAELEADMHAMAIAIAFVGCLQTDPKTFSQAILVVAEKWVDASPAIHQSLRHFAEFVARLGEDASHA